MRGMELQASAASRRSMTALGPMITRASSGASTASRRSMTALGPMIARASSGSHRRRLGPIRGTTENDRILRELLEFEGCEELLRGVRLGRIMRCFGKIFAGSHGDAGTYALSDAVPRLHAFVSHNWIVARWRKQLALVPRGPKFLIFRNYHKP